MHIGILHCGHAPDEVQNDYGDFNSMFERLLQGHGFTFSTWNVVDMQFPNAPDDADGWLISGSRHGVYEDHPFIPPLEDFIRACYAARQRMVGVCFGHQIIAQALGGHVEKYDGGWAIGHQTYDFAGQGALSVNAWHQDQVITPPPSATTIASNDFCKHAALVYGDRAYTIQPHPEFGNDVLAEYLAARGHNPDYPRPVMDRAVKLAQAPIDNTVVAHDMAQFFKGNFTL